MSGTGGDPKARLTRRFPCQVTVYDREGLAVTPRSVCVVDFDFVLALKLPALQVARFLVALECSHGDAHCTSHIPVWRERASTVGASEDPSHQQSICHGDSNILLILKRSTYHQGRVVYIVFSSLSDLILR